MWDFWNSLFNWVAAIFVIANARDIYRRRDVAGHTFPSAIFFAVWAFFSIFYFVKLEQWWTVAPNVAIFVANALLLVLVFRFREVRRG
ncbi:hypothetical protein [Sinorhizobium meliloti]|uniref:hypothetical protein n=1 Tax=Rhizobium meliloti TaxID=382 RepID=UPI0012952DBF|nr:hypothetical protein [Sinorhizobium meliloti]MDW9491694.1 hypothetical protein [Sinorhizobium meliloti]MQV02960.1 hypothetical protein [Sinorhizobium meliloti]